MIRESNKADINGIKEVIDSTGLFPSEYIDEMMYKYLNGNPENELWFSQFCENKLIGVSYTIQERLTNGTFNLLLIAVHKDYQGKKYGERMMMHVEKLLKSNNARILLVETSGLDEYILTRKFYENLNYVKQAVIPEFYNDKEDKIIFYKKL